MVVNSVELMWGPGAIATAYGFEIQSLPKVDIQNYYEGSMGSLSGSISSTSDLFRKIRKDSNFFCLGTIHEYALIGMYWSILISCRRSMSLECTTKLPCTSMYYYILIMAAAAGCIYGMLDCIRSSVSVDKYNCETTSALFVSRGNTNLQCAFATTAFVFGMITGGLISYTRNPIDLFGKKWCQVSAIAGAMCDIVITGTVWWFLRPARTGNVRSKPDYLNKLTQIFVHMGLFTCIVAIAMVALVQDGDIGQFYSALPGSLLAKTYLNSMMAVLNARKSIREQQREVCCSPMEIPTIPTIR
ncbi:hypothetical protein CY34DRAFT_107832 [Suillus luteus UH-Slu-Lm8-n1]|uniref:DUF6534 domain-containing protein n=1 Tax=Suillus luteus UH-Slu-Lm8-n1 TaxID=930992 RepID=A0A0D0B1C1_9AGAM|nr:hypothetical protein CY34DRAFT_107832 [Suillus luteus UH-Slu-Lm8-n1]